MAEPRSPKIFDPYLGEMYGNVLDKYDNPTYNLRLYMKSEGGAAVPAAGAGWIWFQDFGCPFPFLGAGCL